MPKVKEVKSDGIHQIMIFLITLEVMILIVQFMSTMILQNVFLGILSFLPFVAVIGGFEYAYQKKLSEANETTKVFRKKFYKISTWLGAYFPVRFFGDDIGAFLSSSLQQYSSGMYYSCSLFDDSYADYFKHRGAIFV